MDKRFNKGTNVGKDVIEHSLKTLGCGRSCVADNKGKIFCNKVKRIYLDEVDTSLQ